MSDLVPEGWSIGTLPEYVEINPRLIQRAELEQNTQVSFIKMEDVSNNAIVRNVRVVPYEQVSKGFTTFQNKDVLLAKITPCFENGKGGFVDKLHSGVGFGSTEFHVLRAKENSDPRFIYQFTNYPEFRIKGESNMTGSAGQRRVPTDYLRTFDVVFPPFHEQQKIATILSSVDNVIEKTRAQIDKLKDLKTGMMQELLTKGIGHTEFKDSPVGRIPATWAVKSISDVCSEIVDCVNKTAPVVDYVTPYRMIRTTNVRDGRIIMEGMRYVTEETFKVWSRRLTLQNGDVIFTREAPVGECGLVKEATNLFLGQRTMVYRADLEKIDNLFLLSSMQSEYFQSQIEDLSGGSTTPHLRVPDCGKILLKVPPMQEQLKVSSSIKSIENAEGSKRDKLERLESVKKALMQDLLTGKVRVNLTDKESAVV